MCNHWIFAVVNNFMNFGFGGVLSTSRVMQTNRPACRFRGTVRSEVGVYFPKLQIPGIRALCLDFVAIAGDILTWVERWVERWPFFALIVFHPLLVLFWIVHVLKACFFQQTCSCPSGGAGATSKGCPMLGQKKSFVIYCKRGFEGGSHASMHYAEVFVSHISYRLNEKKSLFEALVMETNLPVVPFQPLDEAIKPTLGKYEAFWEPLPGARQSPYAYSSFSVCS